MHYRVHCLALAVTSMRTMALLLLSAPARTAFLPALRRAATRGSLHPAAQSPATALVRHCSVADRSSKIFMEAAAASLSGEELAALEEQVRTAGDAVREAKQGGDQKTIDSAVAELLELKSRLPADHEMLQGGRKAKRQKQRKRSRSRPSKPRARTDDGRGDQRLQEAWHHLPEQ